MKDDRGQWHISNQRDYEKVYEKKITVEINEMEKSQGKKAVNP